MDREKAKDDQLCKFRIYVPVFTGLFDCILCISHKTQKHDIADWQYCVLCHGRTCFYSVTYFSYMAHKAHSTFHSKTCYYI